MVERLNDFYDDIFSTTDISTTILRDYNLPVLTLKDFVNHYVTNDKIYTSNLNVILENYNNNSLCINKKDINAGNVPSNSVAIDYNMYTGFTTSSYSYNGNYIDFSMFSLQYDSSKENNTIVNPVSDDNQLGQLPYFYHHTLSTTTQAIGAVLFVHLDFTMYKGSAFYEHQYVDKILFTTFKVNGSTSYAYTPLFMFPQSSLHPSSSNSTTIWPYSVSYKVRFLYSWWMNNPFDDNIVFWTSQDSYKTADNYYLYNYYYYNDQQEINISGNQIVYRNYVRPWSSTTCNLYVRFTFYICDDSLGLDPQ